jgi:hypothetical protein
VALKLPLVVALASSKMADEEVDFDEEEAMVTQPAAGGGGGAADGKDAAGRKIKGRGARGTDGGEYAGKGAVRVCLCACVPVCL